MTFARTAGQLGGTFTQGNVGEKGLEKLSQLLAVVVISVVVNRDPISTVSFLCQ